MYYYIVAPIKNSLLVFQGEMQVEIRKVGKTDLKMGSLVVGGHGLGLKDFGGKPAISEADAVGVFGYLVSEGMTHFDCTYQEERQRYSFLIKETQATDKVKPVIWHGWHERKEENADDFISNVKFELEELGLPKAGIVILLQGFIEKNASWVFDALKRLKEENLTEGVGLGVMGGARLGEQIFYNSWQHWDMIAPYWNYSLRRQQFMVEFAREQGVGVYSVGAFARGAFLKWPGVNPSEFVRPWLKWILREPSVSGLALSVATLEEAKTAVDVCDGKPMSPEEALYFHKMNFPIQPVDYRIHGEDSTLQTFEKISPEKHGSNMVADNMIRWEE